jgi:hypothetical protein
MKKTLLGFTLIILLFSGCAGNASVSNGPDELDMAIRDASDYLNDNIPAGNMVVILNMQSSSRALSDYIIDELIANAVNDKVFTVVDRQQLDLIRAEQNLQLSGEVDDNLAVSIGKFFGAQTIVSGAITVLGDRYRLSIRALNVETALVQGQYNRNIAAGRTINDLLRSGSGSIPGGSTTAQAQSGGNTQGNINAAPTFTPPPLVTGTIVPGESLAQKLAWLQRSAESHNTYIIVATADENISPTTLQYTGAINITVALRGEGENRTIRLSSNGTMFTVRSNVTFILEENITLQGHNRNTGSMVYVTDGGTFTMNPGAVITGNSGGGVRVVERTGSSFEMNGGTISGNSYIMGGGVYVGGAFTMRGGTITGNTAVDGYGGGGVYVRGNFGTFTKSGGTITGYSSDPVNGNAVNDADGNILARRGHAVYVSDYNLRRENTAGPEVNFSYRNRFDYSGGWEQ